DLCVALAGAGVLAAGVAAAAVATGFVVVVAAAAGCGSALAVTVAGVTSAFSGGTATFLGRRTMGASRSGGAVGSSVGVGGWRKSAVAIAPQASMPTIAIDGHTQRQLR